MENDWNNPPPDSSQPGTLRLFLAGLAGYDLKLLPCYAGKELEHECKKLVRIGASVLIPSFFGFGTAFFFLGPFIAGLMPRVLFSLGFSLVLLAVDCVIVTTLSKSSRFGLVIRIAMSVCLGIVLSEPALLFLYQKTINARIQQHLDVERKTTEQGLIATLGEKKRLLAETDSQLQGILNQLAGYSTENIAQLRFLENEKRRNERLGLVVAGKNQQIEARNALLAEMEGKLKAKGEEIEAKMLEMKEEKEGKRGSAEKGVGMFYKKLNDDLKMLKQEAATLEQQIAQTQSGIKGIRSDRTDEKKVNEEFKSARSSGQSQTVLLTKEEQAEKVRLDGEATAFTNRQSDLRQQVKDLEAKIAGLDVKFDLSTRDDSLTQTETLYEIAAENPVLFVKILSLFFLVFFIDTAPVLVKLTARTRYDDYLQSLARQRRVKSASELDEHHAAVIASTEKRNDQLMDYKRHIEEMIGNISKRRSKRAEAIRIEIDDVVIKHTEQMLREIE